MEVHNRLLEEFPECRARRAEISAALDARLSEDASFRRACGLTTIPIVVHVIHNTDAENITNDQITSQIDALNRDYRANNSDVANVPDVWKGLAQDPLIAFALATTDPDGNSTDGITRTKTDKTSFTQDDSVKSSATGGADSWPSDKYLNIWVCTLTNELLGYAGMVFNLTSASISHAASEDGVKEIITPLIVLGIVATSWALRPASRALGTMRW